MGWMDRHVLHAGPCKGKVCNTVSRGLDGQHSVYYTRRAFRIALGTNHAWTALTQARALVGFPCDVILRKVLF